MNSILMIMLLINNTLFPAYENAKNSFAFIHDQIVLVQKDYISIPEYIQHDARQINLAMTEFSMIKASGFVYSNKKNTTQVVTNQHVCIEMVITDDSKKVIEIIKNIIKPKIEDKNPIILLYYDIEYKFFAAEFNGKQHKIKEVKKVSVSSDLCLIDTEDRWGVPAELNTQECKPSEVIYNISASGGLYHPNAFPLRQGYFNGIVYNEFMTNTIYAERSVYTLHARQGASGSAVFNRDGKVCGNISHTAADLDVCYGSSVSDLKSFLK